MNFKRKKPRANEAIGKQKRLYRTADRMRERRLWRREHGLV